jgi:oligopeptide transport system ATP-binding protein
VAESSAVSQSLALEVRDLAMHFHVSRGLFGRGAVVRAVDGVSFEIGPGEILGLVGESGSGKSTIGRCVARLLEPTAGQILLNGQDITHLRSAAMRPIRRSMHVVFQDPYSSLNPRMTVGEIVGGPLRHHRLAAGARLQERVAKGLADVGLRPELRDRYPHQLSGGQRQRVAIARALILRPGLLIADEPLSALDASVQAATINLLLDLHTDLGFACLFITHDLSAAEFLCDRIAVMYLGKIVEVAATERILARPRHPYTQSLLAAVPVPDPDAQRSRRRIVLQGELPSPLAPPAGCAFHTRCPVAVERCRVEVPPLIEVGPGQLAACHLAEPNGTLPDITSTLSPAPAPAPAHGVSRCC